MENTAAPNENDVIEIFETKKVIRVKRAMIDNSTFDDIKATGIKITNANLSDLEIEGAQLGGAYIHNIGGPPKGHPLYDPNFKQRPLKLEDCNLDSITITNGYLSGGAITDCNLSNLVIDDCNFTGGTITNCNLSNLNISASNTTGMKINGILVADLLKAYGLT